MLVASINPILLQQMSCKSDRNIYMYAKKYALLKIHDHKNLKYIFVQSKN